VWRVRAGDGSAVLKLLRLGASPNENWAASPEPDHPRWWRRELAALQAGVPDLMVPELRPPRLLHSAERSDGSLALWLEDLGPSPSWTIEAVADVARLLGSAQGRIARRPPRLAQGFLRAYLEPRRAHLTGPVAAHVDDVLDRLDRLPATLCHCDLHPANVFPRAAGTVVIDWAYCTLGPLGADAGVLASDALADGVVDAAAADDLVARVWEAYGQGIGDEELAACAAEGYALATALRYAWFPAWIAGRYGPQPDDDRRAGAQAAYDAFGRLASRYL
jgi:hypothetical protein